MKKLDPIKQFLILIVLVSSCHNHEEKNQKIGASEDSYNFENFSVQVPVIPGNIVSITDFGAVGDGQTLNTKAISDAIEHISSRGGGTVLIPRGLWLTGPIILKSNLNIHAEDGALVIFSKDKSQYPLVETSFEGLNTVRCTSPISGSGLENVSFTGKGVFDGSGEAWRPVKKEKLTESQWKQLINSGGSVGDDGKIWYPSESYRDAQQISQMNVPEKQPSLADYEKVKDFLRPVMVSLVNCRNVLLDGPTFQNSPAWCIHPLKCENLIVRNITVKNPWFSQNGDGIDIESCKNSLVCNSSFDVGDDAICIKSGKDADGRKRGRPTENLIIDNCIVYHGHGGVTVGSEMSGGVKNVKVTNCTFIGTDVGIRFKSNRGRGGIVENIFFDKIVMMNIPTQAVSFNLYYGGNEGGGGLVENEFIPPVTEETPVFRNITIRNVTCKGAKDAVFLQGLPEMNLQDIVLENIDIEADNGMTCVDADGIQAVGLRLITNNSPVIDFINCRNINIKKLDIENTGLPVVSIKGERTKSIRIDAGKRLSIDDITISRGADKSEVIVPDDIK